MPSSDEEHPSPPSSDRRSSSRSPKPSKDRDSKAKERSRRSSTQAPSTPGAVHASSSDERKKRRPVADHSGRTARSSSSQKSPVRKGSSSPQRPSSKRKSSHPTPTTPGAVSSISRDKRKGSLPAPPISPGATPSTSRDKRKSSRHSSASPHSSKKRSARPSDEKSKLMANPSINRPSATTSPNDMENGIVAETVDDTEVETLRTESQTTANALLKKNREVSALRSELQRTKEEQNARRGMPLWKKVGMFILAVAVVGGAVAAVLAVTGGESKDAQEASVNLPETSSVPTAQATTAVPDDIVTASPTTDPFLPPSPDVCLAVSEGRSVDGQEDMIAQPFALSMNINLTVDTDSDIWLPGLQRNMQQLVMPPIVGCGNTTNLDVFVIGNALVDQDYVSVVPCDQGDEVEEDTAGSCYIVELQLVLFLKQIVSYDALEDLGQHVEQVFQDNKNLVLDAQDEDSKIIEDIGTLTSKPVTKSPSQQPSVNPTDEPSASPSSNPSALPTLQPTDQSTPGPSPPPTVPQPPGPTLTPVSGPTLAPTPGPTAASIPLLTPAPTLAPVSGPTLAPTFGQSAAPSSLPTPGPTFAPVIGLTPPPTPTPTLALTPGPTTTSSLAPTPGPSLAPSSGPSSAPTLAPSPEPTTPAPTPVPTTGKPSESPSSAPTSKRTRLEAMLARFAPFVGDKERAMDWLVADTWEPTVPGVDELQIFEERFALAVFYYATEGPGWVNDDRWLTDTNACSWTGLSCTNTQALGSVTVLELSTSGLSYGLVNDFPDELRALTNLERFFVTWNKDLSGTIPSFLFEMRRLTELGLGDVGRTGSIPSELWTLTRLRFLQLSSNFLTGAIPPGIGALTLLTSFGMPYNNLSGPLPDEFSGMPLRSFGINENFLTGTIPPLPTSLTACGLALEGPDTYHFQIRKTEGNCFTNIDNAPAICDHSDNQCNAPSNLAPGPSS